MLESLLNTLGVYPLISEFLKLKKAKEKVSVEDTFATPNSVSIVCHLFVSYFIPKKDLKSLALRHQTQDKLGVKVEGKQGNTTI